MIDYIGYSHCFIVESKMLLISFKYLTGEKMEINQEKTSYGKGKTERKGIDK